MTKQQDKVLHGLDSCGFHDGIPNICEVTECPYRADKSYCVHELAHDAGLMIHDLITPRIIPLADLSDRMTGWLEYMGDVIPVIGGRSVPGAHCFLDAIDRSLALVDDQYNVTWRVWTLEPSEDERKAAEWDAERTET